ncbi:MAG: PQQ-binding-like beta-propeller repeat protein [Caldisericia bacterium]|nr:PQQ-binding-like beta-propeller repeat protein [Caldisericia bacterium]
MKTKILSTIFLIMLLLFLNGNCSKPNQSTNLPTPEEVLPILPVLQDTMELSPNPDIVPIIPFKDPGQYPQRIIPIKQIYYPIDVGIHEYTHTFGDLFVVSQCEDGLYSFSRETGKQLFRYKRPKGYGYQDNYLYKNLFFISLDVPNKGSIITCYDVRTGKEMWSYSINSIDGFDIIYCNDQVVVLFQKNYIVLELQSGNVLWKPDKVVTFIADDDNQLIFYEDNKLVKYDPKLTSIVWNSINLPSSLVCMNLEKNNYRLPVDDSSNHVNTIFFRNNHGFSLEEYGYLIDSKTGEMLKKGIHTSYAKDITFDPSLGHMAEPMLYNNRYVYQVSNQDTISCFDIETMTEVWRLQLRILKHLGELAPEESLMPDCWIFKDRLYISYHTLPSHKKLTYCIDPNDGEIIWLKPFALDVMNLGSPIVEYPEIMDIDDAWSVAHLSGFIDLQSGKELWKLKLPKHVRCENYIVYYDFVLYDITYQFSQEKYQKYLFKVSNDGKTQSLYKTDRIDKNLGALDENLKDETSYFFGGVYKKQLCYYEIVKQALEK